MDAYTDQGIDPSQWGSNASWTAWSWAQTGDNYVGPNSGTVPVFGLLLADNSGGWGNVDTFYQQVISGQYDSDYKSEIDAWAQQGYKTVEFRIAWEFNGNFMPDAPGNGNSSANADFIKAWQHVADLGRGSSDVTGGGGADIFVYHAAAPGMMTVEDFSASQGDTVRIDATLKASMHQTSGSSGLMISFGTDTTNGILLKGVSSLPTSSLTWT